MAWRAYGGGGGRGDTHGKRLVGLAKHKSLASPSGTLGYTHAIYIYVHIYPFRDADLFTLFVLNQLSRSRGKSLTPDLSS